MRHIGEKIILVLCIVVFGIAAMNLVEIGKEYYDGQKEYALEYNMTCDWPEEIILSTCTSSSDTRLILRCRVTEVHYLSL